MYVYYDIISKDISLLSSKGDITCDNPHKVVNDKKFIVQIDTQVDIR